MRWVHSVLVMLAVSLATPVFAQQAGGGGGNLRDTLQQLRDNMQNNGVTVQDLVQQAREGTLNQQSLVDQGIISQDMINNIQGQMQNFQQQRNGQARVNPTTLQALMGSSDDEWAVLYPKIQKVIDLSNQLSQGVVSANGRMNNFAGAQGRGGAAVAAPAQSAVAAALAELNAVLAEENAPASDIKDKLTALRQAKEKVKTELNSAEADLIGLITLRQEGLLLTLAYIE